MACGFFGLVPGLSFRRVLRGGRHADRGLCRRVKPRAQSGFGVGGGDFLGQRETDQTHRSTTDLEARLFHKARGQQAGLAYLGHVLVENRQDPSVDAMATAADGTAQPRRLARTGVTRLRSGLAYGQKYPAHSSRAGAPRGPKGLFSTRPCMADRDASGVRPIGRATWGLRRKSLFSSALREPTLRGESASTSCGPSTCWSIRRRGTERLKANYGRLAASGVGCTGRRRAYSGFWLG